MSSFKKIFMVMMVVALVCGMGWNIAHAQEKTVLRVWKFGSPQHEREYMR